MSRSGKTDWSALDADRPLDAILPDLLSPGTKDLPESLLHTRVLEIEDKDGWEWVVAGFKDPYHPRALYDAAKQLIEAAFLYELSQPGTRSEQTLSRKWSGMRFVLFEPTEVDVAGALRSFGFREQSVDEVDISARVEAIAAEAAKVGRPTPGKPASVWFAPVYEHPPERAKEIEAINNKLVEEAPDEFWGEFPGGPSRRLALAIRDLHGITLTPTVQGLETLEDLLVPKEEGCLRWQPPLIFQGFCDFIGVVLAHYFQQEVHWGVSEQEASGFIPPPHLRIGKAHHLAIGMHLLRWLVMPIQPREQIPTLADWLVDEFGTGGYY